MFGLSLGHILILLLIVLLFGAKRLPELGGALGKGLRSFKKGLEGGEEEDERRRKERLAHDDAQSQSDDTLNKKNSS